MPGEIQLSEHHLKEMYFEIRQIELEVNELEIHIMKTQLEIEILVDKHDELSEVYSEYIKPKEEAVEEVKPKKLRKTNDKPGENNTEVQLQEGRS